MLDKERPPAEEKLRREAEGGDLVGVQTRPDNLTPAIGAGGSLLGPLNDEPREVAARFKLTSQRGPDR